MSESIDEANVTFMNRVSTFDFHDAGIVHDRVLLVEGEKFYVQSGLLAVWSEFFHTLFNAEFKEKNETEIELKEVSADEFSIFLQLIYPESLKVQTSHIEFLIKLSHRFLAPHVLNICMKFIDKEFYQFDKILLYRVAATYEVESLKEKTMNFIMNNVESLNLIQLLKLAFHHELIPLMAKLHLLIYTAKRLERHYECNSAQMSESNGEANVSFMTRVSTFDFHEAGIVHDRVLLVEGEKFYVQSGFLAVWSEFFPTLFNAEFKEKNETEIELKDVSADEFTVFLRVIYPGYFEVQAEHLESLIKLSHSFLAPHVLEVCTRFIDKEFGQIDKIMLYKVAEMYDMESLKKEAMAFITENVKSLNLIQLLKLAFDHNLTALKEDLRSLIFTAKRVEILYSCIQCPQGIQKRGCKHNGQNVSPLTQNSSIAEHINEIIKLPVEIQSFVLLSMIHYK